MKKKGNMNSAGYDQEELYFHQLNKKLIEESRRKQMQEKEGAKPQSQPEGAKKKAS